jgi:hypothetical protein
MRVKRRRRRRRVSVNQRLVRVEAAVRKLVRAHASSRRETPRVLRQFELHASDLERHAHDLEIQFKRLAEIQADLDGLTRAWLKLKSAG